MQQTFNIKLTQEKKIAALKITHRQSSVYASLFGALKSNIQTFAYLSAYYYK